MEEKRLIYQVLPRLFGTNKGKNVKSGTIEENGCGKLNHFTPKALQYIREMGFNYVWYTGIIEHAHLTSYKEFGIAEDYPEIVKGKAGSPYAIKDYYDINPDLAENVPNRMAEFEALVKRTKEAGLKTIIDFVPNHVARNYISDAKPKGISDFGANDNKNLDFSPDNNFYYLPNQEFHPPRAVVDGKGWYENPARVTGNDCFTARPTINDWYETVKLNYGVDFKNNHGYMFDPTPNTWYKMLEVLQFWAKKGVDGFRCDMVEMVPVPFWNWVITKIKAEFPDILFIAEVYNPNLYCQYINEGKFDFLYDKVGFYDVLRNVMTGNQSAHDLTGCWQATSDILQSMLYFNENHDEQRLASNFFAGDAVVGKPAMLLSSCLTRNPYMVYFGQEVGEPGMDEEGFSGRDGRTTIFDYWSIDKVTRLNNGGLFNDALLTAEEIDIKGFYKTILNKIAKHEALNSGKFYDLVYANRDSQHFDSSKTFIWFRHTDNEVLFIVAHFGSTGYDARIHVPQHALDTIGMGHDEYFKGDDLINPGTHIVFAKQLLLVNGFGLEIKPYSGMIFKLK